jgi:hypothetical protein
VIIRCTSKLLDLLGTHTIDLVEEEPTEEDWYANLLWIYRRKCLLLAHAGTLFPVFAADVRKPDLEPFGASIIELIGTALRQEHLPVDVLGPLDPGSVHLARTASRSVLGFMNDMALHCRREVEASGGLDLTEVDTLNHRLRRTLHNHDGYREPIELVVQRLHAR